MTENLPGQARVVVVGVIGCGVAYHLTLAGGSYGVRKWWEHGAKGARRGDASWLSGANCNIRNIIGVNGHSDAPWSGVTPDCAAAGAVS